jgi:hypothetical protein
MTSIEQKEDGPLVGLHVASVALGMAMMALAVIIVLGVFLAQIGGCVK